VSPPTGAPRWLVVVGALPDPEPARLPLRRALEMGVDRYDAPGTGPGAFDNETAGRMGAPEE
jgi:hypothetical protein